MLRYCGVRLEAGGVMGFVALALNLAFFVMICVVVEQTNQDQKKGGIVSNGESSRVVVLHGLVCSYLFIS